MTVCVLGLMFDRGKQTETYGKVNRREIGALTDVNRFVGAAPRSPWGTKKAGRKSFGRQ